VPKHSAGLLIYRLQEGTLEVFLAHPGGPYWAKKDEGAWSIPKGEFDSQEEDPLAAARREFKEEAGISAGGPFIPLKTLRQPSGKIIHCWAVEGDFDPKKIKSNTFSLEWPPRSGRKQEFPEIDRADWFDIEAAKMKLHEGQIEFLDRLSRELRLKSCLKSQR
jgi:predicted NUDIX family NTP pyrophosphohydrolase